MSRHSVPVRLCSIAALCILSMTASGTPELVFETSATYTHRSTGSTLSDFDASINDTIFSIVAAPTAQGLDVTSAVAESSDTGTFWSSARSGGLDPYLMESHALWQIEDVRSTENSFIADITGATLELIDFGSFAGMDLVAGYSFEAYLGGGLISSFGVTLSGRGGFNGGNFSVSPNSTPAIYTIQPSGYYSSVRYSLDPFSLPIDLTGIGIGDSYTVRFLARTWAGNAGGETAATAWFRDPASSSGGISVRTLTTPSVSVPEPNLLALFMTGLLMLFAMQRRSRYVVFTPPIILKSPIGDP